MTACLRKNHHFCYQTRSTHNCNAQSDCIVQPSISIWPRVGLDELLKDLIESNLLQHKRLLAAYGKSKQRLSSCFRCNPWSLSCTVLPFYSELLQKLCFRNYVSETMARKLWFGIYHCFGNKPGVRNHDSETTRICLFFVF